MCSKDNMTMLTREKMMAECYSRKAFRMPEYSIWVMKKEEMDLP